MNAILLNRSLARPANIIFRIPNIDTDGKSSLSKAHLDTEPGVKARPPISFACLLLGCVVDLGIISLKLNFKF